MKRVFLLIVVALVLAGCGLSEAAEDTTASVGISNEKGGTEDTNVIADDVVVTVDSVKCDVHPLANSRNQASVTCLLTVDEDSLKLGGDDPIDLYLGGTLKVLADDDYLKPFRDDGALTANGKGTFNMCEGDAPSKNGLFYPCGLPFMILTAQIDGLRVPVEIVGAAATAGASEMVLPTTSENVPAILVGMQCEARMIPDSGIAQIIMIGELKDGREIVGGGLMETGIIATGNTTPMIAGCTMENESENVYLGGALGDENSTISTHSLNFGGIRVTLKLENGDEKTTIVSGWVIGQGPVPN